jgi:hypothetical protein
MTTIETITRSQIKTLRSEALAAGDYHQVDICDRALSSDDVDQDGNPVALSDMTREEALAECARVISDAEAQS